MRKASSADPHVISYESKTGNKWTQHTVHLNASIRIGSVLREMKAQLGLIRNVQLVSSGRA